MKRMLSLALALMLILSLAACAGDPQTASPDPSPSTASTPSQEEIDALNEKYGLERPQNTASAAGDSAET
ncbi:hypothetical protein GMD62_10275, partial [Pseudoflavonifractor sp. BIOML-A14]|nr:hypothetical protein [Pseudoflavonifractor sp. BIOML-A14]